MDSAVFLYFDTILKQFPTRWIPAGRKKLQQNKKLQLIILMKKRLILCFDGTWNSADDGGAPTNVVRLTRAIKSVDTDKGIPQSVVYLKGVGTGNTLDRLVGGITGQGVDANIRAGYIFLSQNYDSGDEIYLFGFSRGAFTARSLSGFIGAAGLLKGIELGAIEEAWDYYRTKPGADRKAHPYTTNKDKFCHQQVTIRCVGVWDTVGALGIPGKFFSPISAKEYAFHDTQPSSIIENAFHAVAIDEKRDEFVPTLWTQGLQQPLLPLQVKTHVEQVWFPGVHSDVGGGYPPESPILSDIPLIWMAQRAATCGLAINWSALPSNNALDPLATMHEARSMFWNVKDYITPTIRTICGFPFKTRPFETRYIPRDQNGVPLTPLNERVHPSALERFGKIGRIEQGKTERYEPRNLAPVVAAAKGNPGLVASP